MAKKPVARPPARTRQETYDADMAAMRERNAKMAAQSPASRAQARSAAGMVPGVSQTRGAFNVLADMMPASRAARRAPPKK